MEVRSSTRLPVSGSVVLAHFIFVTRQVWDGKQDPGRPPCSAVLRSAIFNAVDVWPELHQIRRYEGLGRTHM